MNSSVRQNYRRRHNLGSNMQARDAKLPLDVLFALDRMVVEVSMQLYNVNVRDRAQMRRQNRRLHAAVKQHFPSLLKRAASVNS
jgi:hypothetical protein